MHHRNNSLLSLPALPRWEVDETGVPEMSGHESFGVLVDKLSQYVEQNIRLPLSFEDFRQSQHGRSLRPLISHLSNQVYHPALVSALLALKGHFTALEEASDDVGVNQARGYACEYIAWQFLSGLTDEDIINLLLVEVPSVFSHSDGDVGEGYVPNIDAQRTQQAGERTPLLHTSTESYFERRGNAATGSRFNSLAEQCQDLSALEIASVSGAKKFLSQRPAQKVINGLWRGDVVFWESLSLTSVKKPKKYNRRQADPSLDITTSSYATTDGHSGSTVLSSRLTSLFLSLVSRLRVPFYLKVFETLFFAIFLALYYAVLVHRDFARVTTAEIILYIWIASFAYDEFADWFDAGQTSFYASDFWWTWDISIVVVGMLFCVLRIVGLSTKSNRTTDLAYDVLGLEALFLVPRIFSLLSLNRYFGTLIPCLKEMTKDFVKFLSLVAILYLGFLTTFVLLARDKFKPKEMSWILIKVFFGSSYLGFDVAHEISPLFGPPVMLIFVSLTNILLITGLISLLSNSLSKVLDHARDEYLFIYSVYVLEASSSNRLTYFLPPLISPTNRYEHAPRFFQRLPRCHCCWAASFSGTRGQSCIALDFFIALDVMRFNQLRLRKHRHDTVLTFVRLTSFQNLIPLCIRPLRLVLPSERLRSARIVLLKATHVPFVGAIWAYEQFIDARTHTSNHLALAGPQTPTTSKRLSRVPVNSPHLLLADAHAAQNINQRAHSSRPQTRGGPIESDGQVRALLLKLTNQVEELTSIVSKLQEQTGSAG